MANFGQFLLAGAAVGVGAYALNKAFDGDARMSFDVFGGGYARAGDYHHHGWGHRPVWGAQPRMCDWGFDGRAVNSWAYRQGVQDGYLAGRYAALPPAFGFYARFG